MKKIKIKLLKKFINLWDVMFNKLDQWQVRMWLKMKMKLEELENNQ